MKLDGYRKHGLVHCSQMASYRVEDVTDICKEGDTVYVKVCAAVLCSLLTRTLFRELGGTCAVLLSAPL